MPQNKLIFGETKVFQTPTIAFGEVNDKNVIEIASIIAQADLLVIYSAAVYDFDGGYVDHGLKINYDPPELGEFGDVIQWLNEVGLTVDDLSSLLLASLAALQQMLSENRFFATRKNFVHKVDLSYYG